MPQPLWRDALAVRSLEEGLNDIEIQPRDFSKPAKAHVGQLRKISAIVCLKVGRQD